MIEKPTKPFVDPWKLRMSDEEAEAIIPTIMPYVLSAVQEIYNTPSLRKLYDDDWKDVLDDSDLSFSKDDFPSIMVTPEVDDWLEEKYPGKGLVTRGLRFTVPRIIEAFYMGNIPSLNSAEAEKIAHDDLFRALVREGRWAGTIEPFEDPLHKEIDPENIAAEVLDYVAKHAFYLAQRLHDDPLTSKILAGEAGSIRLYKFQEDIAIERISATATHELSGGEIAAKNASTWIVKDFLNNKLSSLDDEKAMILIKNAIRTEIKYL